MNEALAERGGPQIGKGVGIIGKTLIRHGSEKLKREFLPKILRNEVEFAVGYSEPNAGSDAASMQLRATRDGDGWRLNGQKTWTTSAHFAEWYWLGARTDPDSKHNGITLFLVELDQPGITVKPIWTMGDERTNEVYLEDVWVSDDYVVGDLNHGFQYISEALDLERFTLFTFSPIAQRLDLLTDYVANATRDGEKVRDDAVTRKRLAWLATEAEVARGLGLAFVATSAKGGAAPTAEASEYKLYATELSKRLADASMDLAGPGGQLRVRTEDAPMAGRSESTYRYTVIDTIGGRLLGDPEEHHRQAEAWSSEELLSGPSRYRDARPPARRCDGSRPFRRRSRFALHPHPLRLRRRCREGRSRPRPRSCSGGPTVLLLCGIPLHEEREARPARRRWP